MAYQKINKKLSIEFWLLFIFSKVNQWSNLKILENNLHKLKSVNNK